MKKSITLSLAVATTMAFGASNSDLAAMKAEIEALKAEVAAMKSAKADSEDSSSAIAKLNQKVNEIKAHDANDNIKWGVDLRTSVDSLNYTMAGSYVVDPSDHTNVLPVPKKRSNDSLLTNRLWLNMAYAPDANNIFKGQLAYNKAFGADFGGNDGGMARPRGWGMDTFDWITNESLTGNDLKVRQAYWLYMADKMGEAEIPWTVSLGRRPSTNGFLANLRDDDEAQSPLGHIINVEFDGASASANLGNVTGVPGMSFKLCLGQGSTNAAPMFSGSTNYTDDQNDIDDIMLAGFIFVPYDDGQFIVKTTAFRAFDLPGYSPMEMGTMFDDNPATNPSIMSQAGDIDGAAISILVDGIGDYDILSETKLFGSFAVSRTNPNAGQYMLGMMTPMGLIGADAGESATGTSYWLGAQIPVFGGDLGLEFNHGSKYWRPFDYGEDTMAGSKLAVRGDAWEAYYTYPITQALSAQLRYTYLDYDYSGSNNFFGADGAPMTMEQANAMGMGGMVVDKASDLRFYVRYRF